VVEPDRFDQCRCYTIRRLFLFRLLVRIRIRRNDDRRPFRHSACAPTATIAASQSSVYVGRSVTITATFSAASNDTLTADNIDSPVGTGVGPTTNPDATKTITFTPTTAGTYTFYARATTGYYASWTTPASVTVTVLADCSPSTAYSCTGSGGQTIASTVTDAYCNVTTSMGAICASPYFCSPGAATCLSSSPSFIQNGSQTGHLHVLPLLVPSGTPVRAYWDVDNVQSCTVTSTNGDSWAALTSGPSGQNSNPIFQQTVFNLTCHALEGTTPPSFTEMQTVNVVPVFNEI
jgi:hypothetical protein